jgi:histidine triad (HIT) family protein
MRDGCPFCDYAGPSEILAKAPGVAYVIEPIDPVVPGHVLVVSFLHVRHFTESEQETARVMRFAAQYATFWMPGDCNLITSKGAAATQTVAHLHVHLVPRVEGDGLLLPWSPRG